jgi:hypothetical protein
VTTETNRARPQALSRIDPTLRDIAAKLDIVESASNRCQPSATESTCVPPSAPRPSMPAV